MQGRDRISVLFSGTELVNASYGDDEGTGSVPAPPDGGLKRGVRSASGRDGISAGMTQSLVLKNCPKVSIGVSGHVY